MYLDLFSCEGVVSHTVPLLLPAFLASNEPTSSGQPIDTTVQHMLIENVGYES